MSETILMWVLLFFAVYGATDLFVRTIRWLFPHKKTVTKNPYVEWFDKNRGELEQAFHSQIVQSVSGIKKGETAIVYYNKEDCIRPESMLQILENHGKIIHEKFGVNIIFIEYGDLTPENGEVDNAKAD